MSSDFLYGQEDRRRGSGVTEGTFLNVAKATDSPFFFLALDGVPFGESWFPGGMLRAPIPVWYKEWVTPELLLCIRAGSSVSPNFPPAVQRCLDEHVSAETRSIDSFWLITDVSGSLALSGPVINLSHHAWYFPDQLVQEVLEGRRVEVEMKTGIFTYPSSMVGPTLLQWCSASLSAREHVRA